MVFNYCGENNFVRILYLNLTVVQTVYYTILSSRNVDKLINICIIHNNIFSQKMRKNKINEFNDSKLLYRKLILGRWFKFRTFFFFFF